jgi:hypothetical protein
MWSPAATVTGARLVSGRRPSQLERRVRCVLLPVEGVTLTADTPDRLDGVVDLGLGGPLVDDERVDVGLDGA